jgi:uncharacterized protein (DUF427 family)
MDSAEVRAEQNAKWIRGLVQGRWVVDSRRSLLVWKRPYYPYWFFPLDDIAAERGGSVDDLQSDVLGAGRRFDLIVGDATLVGAAREFPEVASGRLADHLVIDWAALDHWYEEDAEVFVHPRDPYHHIDVLPSSRHVRVHVDGELVADSVKPTILYETGLPPRYYLPASDVRSELLTPTGSRTGCPYKGFASYWSVTTGDKKHEDIVWGYPTPLPESIGIAGLLCFYNEKVDIEIDGEPQARPTTQFS